MKEKKVTFLDLIFAAVILVLLVWLVISPLVFVSVFPESWFDDFTALYHLILHHSINFCLLLAIPPIWKSLKLEARVRWGWIMVTISTVAMVEYIVFIVLPTIST